MAAACLASFAIFGGVLVALYGLDRYKNRKQNRRLLARKVEEEDHIAKEPLAEQLA
jgi:uncharacterized membrane protein YsdA (DUF1294 family)